MKIPHPLVIFAGGKSSRMGRDKALLPFDGHPTLTEYQIARFTPYFENIYVGCKSKEKFDFEADFIEDLTEYEDAAPQVGLISAFEKLKTETIFVLSVDVPFFDVAHFKKLYEYIHIYDAVIAKSPNGKQPLCAIYKRAILPRLKALTKEKKYRFAYLFERVNVKFIAFDDERIFTNLNTPEDYEKAMV